MTSATGNASSRRIGVGVNGEDENVGGEREAEEETDAAGIG